VIEIYSRDQRDCRSQNDCGVEPPAQANPNTPQSRDTRRKLKMGPWPFTHQSVGCARSFPAASSSRVVAWMRVSVSAKSLSLISLAVNTKLSVDFFQVRDVFTRLRNLACRQIVQKTGRRSLPFVPAICAEGYRVGSPKRIGKHGIFSDQFASPPPGLAQPLPFQENSSSAPRVGIQFSSAADRRVGG